jgi:hypothetical protein
VRRSAIILARCLAFVETFDLAPDGKIFFPDLVESLVARYRFQKFPKEFDDLNETKGIEFLEGSFGGKVIEKLVIYGNGILVDTRAGTSVSRSVIQEALEWAKDNFGINYDPGMILRFGYVSQVTFYSDVKFLVNPAIIRLAERITTAVSEIQQEHIDYEGMGFAIGHDALKRKNPLAAFTLAPRLEVPLSHHKYFSEAPVGTDLHWELLEELESAILSQK